MEKPWWIAYPDGRKFNLDEKELVSGVENGNIPAWVQGSYQGGPYVPISQSPAVRSALDRKADREREDQQADTKNKLQVFGAIGGVVLVLVIGGFLINQWNASIAEDQRKSGGESKAGPSSPFPSSSSIRPEPKINKSDPNYFVELAGNVNIGWDVYLRSDKVLIGRITGFSELIEYPDGTKGPGLKIAFASGSEDWIPLRAALLIYVTRDPAWSQKGRKSRSQ